MNEKEEEEEMEIYDEEAIKVARIIHFFSKGRGHEEKEEEELTPPSPTKSYTSLKEEEKTRHIPKRLKCLRETPEVIEVLPRHLFGDVSDAMDLSIPCLIECQKFLTRYYNKPKGTNPTAEERFLFFCHLMEPSHLDLWRKFYNKFKDCSQFPWTKQLPFSPCASFHMVIDKHEELKGICCDLYHFNDPPTDTERVLLFKKLMVTFNIEPDYNTIRKKWLELVNNEDKTW